MPVAGKIFYLTIAAVSQVTDIPFGQTAAIGPLTEQACRKVEAKLKGVNTIVKGGCMAVKEFAACRPDAPQSLCPVFEEPKPRRLE